MEMTAAPQGSERCQHESFCTFHVEQQSAQAVGCVDSETSSNTHSACRPSVWEEVLTLRTAARSDAWGGNWELVLATAPWLGEPAPSWQQQQLCQSRSN